MTNILRYNIFLLALFSIIFYFSINKIQLFGQLTQLFNIFTLLVLLAMGIYYPRFSKGIGDLKRIKIKLIWMTVFLLIMFGFNFSTQVISDGVFYIIVITTCIFWVINFSKIFKSKESSLT
ncbi:hypothetical protein F0342_07060 [Bacillus sp. CH30_1T]|uniref:hypothetical protein n=1 Tax=Bacillus sp. CH30_1T TaxID=2604836 RepID=UPI0011EC87D6|nr:hypothetical protein [Bacillus sp. CH30_1T]KAA0565360.1 hypothetical protein F0342_07060 [Bacillus sp. CH30_1T]